MRMTEMEYFTSSIECLSNGAPHAKEAGALCDYFSSLGEADEYHFVRAFISSDLYQKYESLKDKVDFSIDEYKELLSKELELAKLLIDSRDVYKHKLISVKEREKIDDMSFTQQHYGNLFKDFNEYHYYDEPFELLSTRLERNNIELKSAENKVALDCGCGGGRYTLALKKLGFGNVHGVDFSEININTAKERVALKNIKNVEYKIGNVHDIPHEDEKFDFVFCNGVLHHSRSIKKGIEEMVRVMKSGGEGWLYLINKPGGTHWDTVEIIRSIIRPISQEYARSVLRILGVPENRVFHLLDHTMVPINTLSSAEEIEAMLHDNGITEFRRLDRGTDFDLIEKIHQLKQEGKTDDDLLWTYGVGEHRYFFQKP